MVFGLPGMAVPCRGNVIPDFIPTLQGQEHRRLQVVGENAVQYRHKFFVALSKPLVVTLAAVSNPAFSFVESREQVLPLIIGKISYGACRIGLLEQFHILERILLDVAVFDAPVQRRAKRDDIFIYCHPFHAAGNAVVPPCVEVLQYGCNAVSRLLGRFRIAIELGMGNTIPPVLD